MSAPEALWIDEEQVAANVSLIEAIDIIQQGFEAQARGDVMTLEKSHVACPGGSLHALGAVSPKDGFAGTKTWTHSARGSTPLLLLFDLETGALRSVIEAFGLGQLRTAAISAVGTRWLAAPDAGDLALIGTGRQAFAQVAAVACVRRLRRVRVFSPNPEHRKAFVAQLRAEFSREVVEAASLEAALDGAPIVTLATRASAPFLEARMLARGAHVNAIGAITPERAEVAQDVIARANRVVVDELVAARRLSRELSEFYGPAQDAWNGVETLAQVVAEKRARAPETELTLLKAMGTGLADLVLGIEIHRRVLRAGGGREIPQPERVRPRLLPGGLD
jgi:alanine dehydrogenase